MVVSQIDGSISYPEIKSIMVEDRKKNVDLFLIEIHSFDIVSAIGNQIDTYKSKQVVYHPVYMIKNNGKAVQIGVYELSRSDVISFSDENDNLDIERLGVPLIYTFVTKSYIDKNRMIPPDEEKTLTNTKEEISDKQQSKTSEKKTTEMPNKIDNASVVLSIPSLRSDIFLS